MIVQVCALLPERMNIDSATIRAKWPPIVVGAICSLIGTTLLIGGAWLLAIRGSPYYVLAGIAMLVSGVLLIRRHLLGTWIYIAMYVATFCWALWEVGLNSWALVARLVALTVLLGVVIVITPFLSTRVRWRSALLGVLAVVVSSVVFGFILARAPGPKIAHAPFPAAPVAEDMSSADQAGVDWVAYGATYSARRYSSLMQINAENVSDLTRVWVAHTGDLPNSKAARDMYGAETTPLKIGDSLYLCSAKSILISLDAASGKERWRYDPKVADKAIPYTAACRGVAYYVVPDMQATEACATRVIEGTLDARLVAVDAQTGRPCPGFGRNGNVDTTVGMGKSAPGMVSITSPPTIVRGVLITGHQILDGQMRWAPSGVIQGFDAVTGELRWAWDMMRPDITGLPPEGQIYTPGTPNLWTIASGDEELGLVYLPLGNSAADYLSSSRREQEKQYSSSLVAMDVTTGKPAWSFQTVHNDVWDYDLGSQATLVDFPTAQGSVPALVLSSKKGDVYVLDRRTGHPLSQVEERGVPQGGVEPEQRARTQPFSLYHTLRKPNLTEKTMWGISPVDQMICRIQFREAIYNGIYTPPVTQGHSIEYPGYNGGSDWGGIAFDPVHGVIVANYNDMPNYVRLVPRAEADKKGWAPRSQRRGEIGGAEGAGDPQVGVPFAVEVNAGWRLPGTKLLCKEPPYGGIRAIELRTGKTIWDEPLGTARMNGPFGIPSMLPVTIGTPNNGGAVITAGNLIFIAAATDNLIRAIDLTTGKTLWKDVLPAGGQATPMTYEAQGRQYLVIMAGGHHFMETPIGDSLVAYALPR